MRMRASPSPLRPQDQCTFNGAWRGAARVGASYYISSYFWDRAIDSGIISDERALTWKTTPGVREMRAGIDSCRRLVEWALPCLHSLGAW